MLAVIFIGIFHVHALNIKVFLAVMRGIAYSPVVLHLQLSQGLILVELCLAALYFQTPIVYNHVDILFLNLLLNTGTMYKDMYTKLCRNLQEAY